MSTLFARLQQHGREQADRPAVWQHHVGGTHEPTTFGRLASTARRFANAFQKHVPAGTIIPMCLAKSADCMAAMVEALGAGRAFSCLNPKLRPPQIERILTETGTPLALIDGPGLMTLKGSFNAGSPMARVRWWLVRGRDFAPTHERLAEQLRAVATVEEWNPDAWGDAEPSVSVGPNDVGCCLFTSGSTGTPKGVMISQNDLRARADAEVLWYGLTPQDRLLSILPLSFDVGLNQMLSFLSVGCELVTLDSWFPKDILKTAEARNITGISSVPSIWLDFMRNNQRFQTDGVHATLRYLTVSGGDMSKTHLEQLPGLAPGVGIFKTYGQTEAFRATSLKPHEFASRTTSVGRAFHGVHVYIVREDGTRAAANEVGEVVHTGLGVMLGYLGGQDPENKLRANPFRGPEDDSPKAVFTGDQGYLDAEGYLFLSGRRDDMIKIQGNRVYPNEVRDYLLTIPDVAIAEVIGIKDPDLTRLTAFVALKPGVTMKPSAIQLQLAARAPSYMVPELVVIKSEFPRTASGKPDRPALAAEARTLLKPPMTFGI